MTSHDLVLRPITGPDELSLFNRFEYVLNAELAGDLAAGRRRPEWLWLALRDGRPVARAAWWARPGGTTPLLMDIFDLSGSPDDGERLLRAALAELVPAGARPPEFLRFVPPDWRADPAARRGVEDRMAVLERTGARVFVERLRLEWRPGTSIAAPSGRLTFRPVRDPDDLIGLMTRVLDGTLDAYSRDDLTRHTAAEAARQQYEQELERYDSPHDWWRIAETPSGEPAGFVIPAHNGYSPIIAYLGVLPGMRGRGYVDDLLAEGTRILADQGVPRIRAATDVGNTPMAAAFERAGYVTRERQIDMTWPEIRSP
ncbi:MAG TPA: GNAT family N-acetyltransferase [Actinoplanes sp.]|nr:GNAT family N-acetyltransferase [Actinoplanes sp.]